MLSTPTERCDTLDRWRKLLSDTTEKGLTGSNAYAQLAHEMEQCRVDAIFARAKEENGNVAARGVTP